MKKLIVRSIAVAALSAGAVLAAGAPAQAHETGHNAGILSGSQVSNLVNIRVNVCGNALSLLGSGQASCGNGGGAGSSARANRLRVGWSLFY